MSVVTRGVKNAFRNWLRTLAVVLILGIGIGLSMSMLVANEAVNAKITDLKTKVGTTLMVTPAGARGFEGGGEPLTMDTLKTVQGVSHVASATAVSNFRLENQDAANDDNGRFMGGNQGTAGKTSLQSAIEPGTLGRRNTNGMMGSNLQLPANFSLPINGTGSTGTDATGAPYKITAGRTITSADTDYVALVGSDLATKNNLSVGSAFTAYDHTFTVVGIFTQGNKFDDAGVVFPLGVAQTLSGTANEVSAIIATIDSADNVTNAQTALKNTLGGDKADVSLPEAGIQTTLDSLKGVQQITVIAFVGALIAAAVIIFLIMLMIVRERTREIGVLKAIGGSNATIVSQFIVESLVLVLLGTAVGFGVSLLSSNSIANALVASSNTANQSQPAAEGMRRGGFRSLQLRGGPGSLENAASLVGQVTANVGWMTVVYGLLAAIGIAVVGSAVPAWLISKVRPAVVLRGE